MAIVVREAIRTAENEWMDRASDPWGWSKMYGKGGAVVDLSSSRGEFLIARLPYLGASGALINRPQQLPTPLGTDGVTLSPLYG